MNPAMPSRVFSELLRGKGAHADPLACLEDIGAEVASRQVEGFPHSIGGLVFHMNYWMDYDFRRIRGERPPYPAHNSETFPAHQAPADAQEWDDLRRRFAALLADSEALMNLPQTERERQIEPMHEGHKKLAATLESVLWQTVAHNSYHIGQIAMIRRVLGVWPPRAGGDTW